MDLFKMNDNSKFFHSSIRNQIGFLVVLFFPTLLVAQGVADTEILIEKQKEIKLKPANKSFEKIKIIDEPSPEKLPLFYTPEEPYFQTAPFSTNLSPYLPGKDEQNPDEFLEEHQIYLKAGYGNYRTSLLEAYLQHKRNKQLHIGLNLKHLASKLGEVADEFSGASQNSVQAYGKYFFYNSRLDAKISYHRQVNRFFAYPLTFLENADLDSLKQVFNRIRLEIQHQSTDTESNLQYQWGLAVSTLKDQLEASEWQVNAHGKGDYLLSESLRLQAGFEVFLSQRQDSAKIRRNLIKVSPAFMYQKDRIFLRLGIGLAYDNDTLEAKNGQFYLYPQIKGSYQLNNQLSIFAGLEGDLQTRSLDYWAAQNPWIADNIALAHTNKQWEASGGVRVSPIPNLSVVLGVSYGTYQNAGFFINSLEDSARFDVIYEREKTRLLTLSGQASYTQPEKYDITLKTSIFAYDLSTLEEAWHRPTFEAQALAGFFPLPKLQIQANLLFQSGIKAKNLSTDNQSTLDAITDLSFKADYLFFNNFSAYLSVNNIFNKSYRRFLYYSNQRLNYLIGLTYAF
ncbi:MAG: hypothetical protein NW226_24480 [Microscillaceae bacterium]|nr:hypothetical protein [Microscillaceae bacterium]